MVQYLKKKLLIFLINKNIKLLSDDIKILKTIRSLGNHIIEINPYDGIKTEINVKVKKT